MDSDDFDKGLDIEAKSRALTLLRKACGRYGIVPTSYVLTGVVNDGHLPQKNGITTETWRGTYRTKTVAIKKFKIPKGEEYDKIKAVRQAVHTHFSSSLMLPAEILQRSRPLETAGAREYTPLHGRLKGYRGILSDLSVDEQRYHHGVHP